MSDKEPKDSLEQQIARDEIKHKHLEFLDKLRLKGVPLKDSDLKKLQDGGFIPKPKKEQLPKKPASKKQINVSEKKSEGQKKADAYVDVVRDSAMYHDVSDVPI